MPDTLVVVSMVRNEASRYLESAVSAWRSFADEVVILDDDSSDNTVEVCREAGAVVHHRVTGLVDGIPKPAWGHEAGTRRALWDLGVASGADWIFFLDADMVPGSSPRPLLTLRNDAVAFRLYDLWGEAPSGLLYRSDNFWYGHEVPRVWLVRNPGPSFVADWNPRGIHCGHLPQNLPIRQVAYAPDTHSLLHYAYLKSEHRRTKLLQYRSVAAQLSGIEAAHAESIADPDPHLEPLLWEPQWQLRSS